MTFTASDLRRRRGTVAIWVGGAVALIGMVAFALATTTPYPTVWPWLSFIGMAILEEALVGPADGSPPRGPRIALVAAIIMFRKHPDVVALVTVVAGVAGGILTRQSWLALLTRITSLAILAAAGVVTLRAVGYADTPHFVAATAALILLYAAASLPLTAQVAEGGRQRHGLTLPGRLTAGVLGALLALAWRTPLTGPLMLRLGELATLAVIGIAIGFARGGDPRGVLRQRLRLSGVPVLVILGAIALIVSTRLPSDVGWIAAAAGLASIGVFALRRRWLPVALMLLGGLGNEIARGVNGGRMPVATAGLPPDIGEDLASLSQTSTTYQAVDAHTRLAWLADRFPLAPFPGLASPGDLLLGLGIVWIFAALTVARPEIYRSRSGAARAA